MKRLLICALLAFSLLLPATGAQAAYPDRPITIIIPFGPGGAVDVTARILAEYFQTKKNITLNIICKGGGAGVPAMLDVLKARPDGYTFAFPALATFSFAPQVKNTGYTKDNFRPVAQVTVMWLSLSVNKDSGITDVKGLFEAARANPGKYNFGTHGGMSVQRLFMTNLLKSYPDVTLPHVAYTSGYDVSTAMLGRHITAAFGVTVNQKPFIESGDFTMIGVSSPQRLPEFPDVPTFAEQFGEEFVFPASHGIIADKRVPDSCVEFMQNAIKDALEDPDVQAKFAKAGLSADYLPASEFQGTINKLWDFFTVVLRENKF